MCKFMTRCAGLLAVALLLVSAGCSDDPKAANEKNFGHAAQDWLDQEFPICVVYGNFPLVPPLLDVRGEGKTLQAMAKAGLVTGTPAEVEDLFGGKTQSMRYELTENGKKYYFPDRAESLLGGNKLGGLCFGKGQLESVENFTTPAQFIGLLASQVTFTYRVTDIPDWVQDGPVADDLSGKREFKEILASRQTPIRKTQGFIQTEKGWVHEKLFKK